MTPGKWMHSLHTRTRVLLVAALVILGSGCASKNVDWDYDPAQSKTLTGYKTYAWVPTEKPKGASYDVRAVVQERIHTAIDQQLAAKGYKLVQQGSGTPDFLVNDRTEVQTRTEARTTNNYIGYSRYPWSTGIGTETIVRDYQQGTLIIDVIDPKTNKLVWTGHSWARLASKSTPEEKQEKIDKAVTLILGGFPHPPKKD